MIDGAIFWLATPKSTKSVLTCAMFAALKRLPPPLATVLDLDYAKIFGQISSKFEAGKQEYLVVADFVTADKIEKLADLKTKYNDQTSTRSGEQMPSLIGLVWTPHLMRSYPEKSLASNILGFYSFQRSRKRSGLFWG